MIDVTTVTRNASQDALRDADYLRIIDSLRTLFGYSWQRIADETGYNSKAYWHQVYGGTRQLDDAAKNALRRVTDGELPEQPISVSAAVERFVHKDAEVSMVGPFNFDDPDARVHRVLLMASNDVTVHVNGEVIAKPLQTPVCDEDTQTDMADNVTHVTSRISSVAANYAPSYRPRLPVALKERVEASGVSVETLIERGLAMEVTE